MKTFVRTVVMISFTLLVFSAGYISASTERGLLDIFAIDASYAKARQQPTEPDCDPVVEEPTPNGGEGVEDDSTDGGVVQTSDSSESTFVRFDWVFPDSNINPVSDIQNGSRDVLSIMWAELDANGRVIIRQGSDYGRYFHYDGDVSNADSTKWVSSAQNGGVNGAIARSAADKVLLNVSSANVEWMTNMAGNSANRSKAINTLVDFVRLEDFDGVDIDFEDFGSWSSEDTDYFLLFLTELKAALHANGYVLSVDLPPIWNSQTGSSSESGTGDEWDSANSQSYYTLTYTDINTIAPDYAVIMAYDYHYDYSAGRPNQPLAWMGDILNFATERLGDSYIIVGIPAAGYSGATGGYGAIGRTYDYLSLQPGFLTASIDQESGELIWSDRGTSYAISTDYSIDVKVDLAKTFNIDGYALWHIGGNRDGTR